MGDRIINHVVLLPVEQIDPNPGQPRKVFLQAELEGLATSIEKNGLLQPIHVRRIGERYELIAGERRLRAYRLLGYYEIPSIVEEMDGQSSKILALIENLQHSGLNFFEQAQAMQQLLEETSLSQTQLAKKLGMAQSTLANKLRLLQFSSSIREEILLSKLTERHARCLLQLGKEEQIHDAILYIRRKNLNVAQAEQYVAGLIEKELPKPVRLFVVKDVRIFFNTINKAIETMKNAGIHASTCREEDDEFINITVRIPKKTAVRKTTA